MKSNRETTTLYYHLTNYNLHVFLCQANPFPDSVHMCGKGWFWERTARHCRNGLSP